MYTRTDLIDLFGKCYQINENDQTFGWLMINEVDPYLVFLKVCETIDKCSVIKNNKGFDITIDNIENSVLVEDMKKWGLHRRVNERQCYNLNDRISTDRIYRFETIK